ncbi:hypothetical protein [Methylobacterium sp. Leaf118]|uniref:hypothetical protein n=1 Tax=Methylobacterium sp. Leaf118 TaxID=2876562 RepID=UPI001E2B8764|nr:hypothetical protein [Methylobacterium sp. Leaf118]
MTALRTSLSAAHRGLRFGRGALRTLSLLLVSVIGLGALGASVESPLEDDPDRNGHVVFRHFV